MADVPTSPDLYTDQVERLPPRVEEFRRWMASAIPCSPNTTKVRTELNLLPLPKLMGIYVNWARRLVPTRQRELAFASGFWEGVTGEEERAVYDLASLIRRGEDIMPYLSDRAAGEGYAPKRSGKKGPNWAAKDFALNAWGVHHLHLRPNGSRQLLYVLFDRESALAVLLGDHKSFDNGALERRMAEVNVASGHFVLKRVTPFVYPDIDRTMLARRGMTTISEAAGQAVMGAFLATDGSSVWNTQFVRTLMDTIQFYEKHLDTPGWLRGITSPPTDAVAPRYRFLGTDLCIIASNDLTILLVRGFC